MWESIQYFRHGAGKHSRAKGYPTVARQAIREMHRQVGDLVLDGKGIGRKGLIIRHLVLPGGLAGTEEVATFVAKEISPNTYVNLMDQYYPAYTSGGVPVVTVLRPTSTRP